MRIGVFGDSFADRIANNPLSTIVEDESWIKCLENKGHKVVTYGKTGTSTYWSFCQFMSHYEQFDHIIFFYSSLSRIHHMPKGLEDLSFLTSPDEFYATRRYKNLTQQQELEAVRILTGYIPNMDLSFDMFVKQHIFEGINNVCRNKNIKLINVLTFDDRKDKNYNINLDLRSGDVLYNLYDVSKKEISNMDRVDNRWCHLSMENNQIFSDILLESLTNGNKNIIDLYKKPFIFSKEITQRYESALVE